MTTEIIMNSEVERVDFSLRYHHLEWLSEYTLGFVEKYGNPWNSDTLLNQVVQEAQVFNAKTTDRMLASAVSLPTRLFKPFKRVYYQDVYGKSFGDKDVVTQKRGEYFSQLVRSSVAAPQDFLKLTSSPDGVCKSCAVGKHCESNYPAIIKPLGDADFITQHSLMYLSRRKFSGIRRYEKSVIVENGDVSVANRILFDKKFYLDLTGEIRKRFITAVDFEYWNSLF